MQLPSNRAVFGLTGLLLLTGVSSAIFTNALTPGFRGSANSEFSQWENFQVAFGGGNAPDDPASTSDDARIEQFTPGAIVTSTMNIYHPSATPVFVLSDTVPADAQEIYFQVRTLGNPLSVPGTSLEFLNSAGAVVVLPFDSHQVLSMAGGALENLFYWDLSGISEEVTTYQLNFAGTTNNMSLDTVQLDVRFGDVLIGTAYCQAEPNSTGFPGLLSAIGSDVASENDVTLRASNLPLNQFGYFINSDAQGLVVQPGGSQGNLCLVGAIGRHNALLANTGTTGELVGVLDLNALPQPSGAVAVMAGETWNFQAWYRDANPTGTSNFTQGISISFQ